MHYDDAAHTIRSHADALAEIAKHLSPTNENVTRGYLVAAIRDLAQIAVSARDNFKEQSGLYARAAVERDEARAEVRRLRRGVNGVLERISASVPDTSGGGDERTR